MLDIHGETIRQFYRAILILGLEKSVQYSPESAYDMQKSTSFLPCTRLYNPSPDVTCVNLQ